MGRTVQVGEELPALGPGPVSRVSLALFAGASGDHNPMHIDIDAARSGGLDDVIAPGMLSMAYLARLLTGWVPQERILSWRARFTSVTPVHGDPTCTGRVTAVTDEAATIELAVTLSDGTLTLIGDATVALDQ
ncbi:MaoC/PaaZ C-terminal domain-containing protein [Spirillospora sp. NPDC048823]|uniref:MaoC/PaaZ C-terminal domain-containing protein n=1 Tax=unclassified Spirillospora TaxID=2642701 RepID=UPI00371AE6FB